MHLLDLPKTSVKCTALNSLVDAMNSIRFGEMRLKFYHYSKRGKGVKSPT